MVYRLLIAAGLTCQLVNLKERIFKKLNEQTDEI